MAGVGYETIQGRVYAIVGDIVDVRGIDTFCAQEARTLVQALPARLLSRAASREVLTGGGGFETRNNDSFAIAGRRVLRVVRDGIPAKAVDPGAAGLVRDPSSLHYASARSPVFYEQVEDTGTRLYVKPDPSSNARAQIDYVEHPDHTEIDAVNDERIKGLPIEADEAFTLGVALRLLAAQLAEARASLPDLAAATLDIPELPGKPGFPDAPDITDELAALSTVVDALGDGTLDVPSMPEAPDLPALTIDLSDALSDLAAAVAPGKEDPELADAVLRRVNAMLAEFKAEVDVWASAMQTQASRFAAEIQGYASEAQVLVSRYGAEVQARTGYPRLLLEEYTTGVQAEAARHSAYVRQFTAVVQGYATEAQAHVARHGAELTRARADAEAIAGQLATVQQRYDRALSLLLSPEPEHQLRPGTPVAGPTPMEA